MATLISDGPDGPVHIDLANLPDAQLKDLVALGDPDATRLWLRRQPVPKTWAEQAADRMGPGRGKT